MAMEPISFAARVLRKEEFLPRYIVVKAEYVRGRTRAFPADVMLNDAGRSGETSAPGARGPTCSSSI